MTKNEQAWAILKEDEKLALTLKHGHGKSTWEAGEIMDKAHYKFLEIEARAKKFLKIFTEHFEMFGELIPPGVKIEPRFLKYLELTMRDRKSIPEVIYEIGDTVFSILSFRERLMIEEMEKMLKVEKVTYRSLALLILEFDRWNNYRILPRELQEPSAFKRRNKKNDIKNIKNIWELNSFVVDLIHKKYQIPETIQGKIMYVPLPSKLLPVEKYMLVAKYSEKSLKELTRLGLYAFSKRVFAQEFLDLILSYKAGNFKHPKEGLKFWPKYRLSTKNAINYNFIQKRIASRKFLDSALRDMDINFARPKKTPEFI